MSAYNELIKSFERIRAYVRDFYIYGFRSREEFRQKSARSYDDERRRVESWLGEYMRFIRSAEGKSVFLSIDSRITEHNPLYKAWKAKSFTDGDITLHFILLDILFRPEEEYSLSELMKKMEEEYFSCFPSPMTFDESTVRKKLKEYLSLGIVTAKKCGRSTIYSRAADDLRLPSAEALHFFSEAAPCGVVGSFLLDRVPHSEHAFGFKHHYITSTLEAGVLCELFDAMRQKRRVSLNNHGRDQREPKQYTVVPLCVYYSVQSGRQYLACYHPQGKGFRVLRLDRISDVKQGEAEPEFDTLRQELSESRAHTWGVNIKKSREEKEPRQHVSFTVRVERGEEHIIRRLYREKRCGSVEPLDASTYRFSASVYDAQELLPWIRTFICRIQSISISDKRVEKIFFEDLRQMYRMYGIDGGQEV